MFFGKLYASIKFIFKTISHSMFRHFSFINGLKNNTAFTKKYHLFTYC